MKKELPEAGNLDEKDNSMEKSEEADALCEEVKITEEPKAGTSYVTIAFPNNYKFRSTTFMQKSQVYNFGICQLFNNISFSMYK